ncbi:MAG: hypothetical protein NC218_00755 [Acetobacter sp.]|nr:hypothetical protein [Acetobacter sp.]
MQKQRVGDIEPRDVWAFVFRCVGIILFPILLFMPVIVIWRVFFYEPEDFWCVVWGLALYIFVVVDGVLLCSVKTIIECDEECLHIFKKWCFLFEFEQKRICFKDIQQITFAEVVSEDTKLKSTLKKVFRLKLLYELIYKLGSFLMRKGRMLVCITYGKSSAVVEITDIKKNDERYLYLQRLKEQSVKE